MTAPSSSPAARPAGDGPTPGACVCGHPDVARDLARDRRTRTRCSRSDGPKATPCGCASYQEVTS